MDKGQWFVTGAILGGALFSGLAYILGANKPDIYFALVIGILAGKFVGWKIGKATERKQNGNR